MKSRKLNSKTDQNSVNITLDLGEIKILHNACVDILNDYPEMIGYKRVRNKLKTIIDSTESDDFLNDEEKWNNLVDSITDFYKTSNPNDSKVYGEQLMMLAADISTKNYYETLGLFEECKRRWIQDFYEL